ncbi:MAG: hypothetical protein LBG88_00660 [Christensenellaceae bacterium]|jgi:hypothetical protein|nr:hypothetical protein [Christensenellaceae bacterium]
MMKKNNKLFLQFKCWYDGRLVRRVAFWGGLVALFLMSISGIDKSGTLLYFAIGTGVIAVGASTQDTLQDMIDFRRKIKKLEFEHKIRETEIYGRIRTPSCFTPEDKKEIIRKKTTYGIIIAFKLLLIVILIAYCTNLM